MLFRDPLRRWGEDEADDNATVDDTTFLRYGHMLPAGWVSIIFTYMHMDIRRVCLARTGSSGEVLYPKC